MVHIQTDRQTIINSVECWECKADIGHSCVKDNGDTRKSIHMDRVIEFRRRFLTQIKTEYDPTKHVCQGCGFAREYESSHKNCVIEYVACSECKAPKGIPCQGSWNPEEKKYDSRSASHQIRWTAAEKKRTAESSMS